MLLVGPRQVGKTTLAQIIAGDMGDAAIMIDCERPDQAVRLADPDAFLDRHRQHLVILDEVQFLDGIFRSLRPAIDADRRPGRFLLLGSASPELIGMAADSLAGRITTVELTPFRLDEVPSTDADRLWLRGGMPLSHLAADDAASLRWREAFLTSYIERELPRFDVRLPATTLRRFWSMLAHLHCKTFPLSEIANSLGIDGKTVARYCDLLGDLFLLRQLVPWSANTRKRLVKTPKIYWRDPGTLHALLGLGDLEALLGHPVCGSSWEGFIIEQLLALLSPACTACYYLSHARAEVDLVIEDPAHGIVAVDVKRSTAPQVTRGLINACEDLDPVARWLVAPVAEPFPARHGFVVLPPATAATRVAMRDWADPFR